jgi:hypothetical protein
MQIQEIKKGAFGFEGTFSFVKRGYEDDIAHVKLFKLDMCFL